MKVSYNEICFLSHKREQNFIDICKVYLIMITERNFFYTGMQM